MTKKSNPPSINKQAFDCPYCGAYTTQYWYNVLSDSRKDNAPPTITTSEYREYLNQYNEEQKDDKIERLEWCDMMDSGIIFFSERRTTHPDYSADNIHFSKCYHCKKIAVWIHGNLIFPNEKIGVIPNPDLPEEIIRDFEEARSILGESPRGAAALLRLCVQKLCIHLGEKGKNIDDDIASLVKKGLNPLVQKSLDIIRVIGNEAIHPGVIDLNDDRDTASQLLSLINSIADQMISHPKNVEAMYEKLPESKRNAIEKRNEKLKN
ncbi:DUF4145 domain-containing protein [bacterium]|nr:DUF4145 domain-containing protein [bacterium]